MDSQYRDHPGSPNRPSFQHEYPHDNIQASHSIPLVAPYGAQPLATNSGELGQYYDDDRNHDGRIYHSPSAGRGAGVGLGAGAAAAVTTDATAPRLHYGDRREFVDQDANERWLQDTRTRSGNKRSKWMIIGGVALLVVIIIIAVVIGVVVSRKKTTSSSSSGTTADPNNAANFQKDSNLKRSFYGIAYTPTGSLLPDCGNKLEEVIRDVQLLSQITPRIRLYGADCNQTALVLDAIARTKVDLQVYLGNYPVATDNGAAYARQRDDIKNAIQTFGVEHVAGITVGNEFILNYLGANGGTDQSPDGSVGNQGAAILINNIKDTKQLITGMSLSKDIPIGNADAGSYFNQEVLKSVAYGMSNVHPWFANQSVDAAADWTFQFFRDTNVNPAAQLSNKPQMSIAETGWPTKSSDEGNKSNGPSLASTGNLQTYINNFVCQANQNGVQYFFFEFCDEPWKDQQFGGVEGWWGLFNNDRTLKNITIPDCAAP